MWLLLLLLIADWAHVVQLGQSNGLVHLGRLLGQHFSTDGRSHGRLDQLLLANHVNRLQVAQRLGSTDLLLLDSDVLLLAAVARGDGLLHDRRRRLTRLRAVELANLDSLSGVLSRHRLLLRTTRLTLAGL